jgi:heavy metal sensor kinase
MVALYAGLLALVFLCFGAYTYWGFRQFLAREMELSVERRAHQIAVITLERSPNHPPAYIENQIKNWYAPELNERVIRITDAQGKIFYASPNVDLLVDHLSGITPRSTGVGAPVFRKETGRDGETLQVVALNCRLQDGTVYTVEVGAPVTEMATALHDLLITLAFGFPVFIGLSIAGGYFLLGRALRPVNEIVSAAERITYKNLSHRLPVPQTGDEFERISVELNRMITRLDEAFQIATRFSTDASHELRTPLTIIRGELEIFVKNPELSAESSQLAADILEEVERLSRIVEGLLLVSRLEAGEAQMKFEVIDLGEMVSSVAAQMELLSEHKSLTLTREISPRVIVEGDESRLKQVTVNLLDNAIKYTPSGGSIVLRVFADAGHAVLEIIDTGIGIEPAALPHVFDRFFRAEQVKAARMEGTGLGLSIVQSITEAHGGSVSVQSGENEGTRVRVELPLYLPDKNRSSGIELVV